MALVVPLRRTERCQRKLVAVADFLRYVCEIIPCLELGSLNVSVTPFAASENTDCPTVLHQSGRHAESYVIESVVTHPVPYGTTLLCIKTLGSDVDGAADRG